MPVGLMGDLSNSNPYCGKMVTITYGGKTVTAMVKDKCMGCKGGSIDMTQHLFVQFADMGEGRLSGVQWWFN
ncbi:hypothetical protein HCEG_01419 [Histoplasma capsulatum var. duboisii H88]|nr:hypothetical protein HCEG_01419 [Histoplasma capsulatum var. duboisii H88]